ncbi:uncharacterized protein [Rutidosis leptorrhynchoides]|uniref:uncharacterized protein n=1 Tax=Rutidosis leptorrhynchoides TaxID=125765 RepID=UPI003A9A2797
MVRKLFGGGPVISLVDFMGTSPTLLMLCQVLYLRNSDAWTWTLANNGIFSIKKLTTLIDCATFRSELNLPGTLINKMVPLKIELFIWRARRHRIPVRVELDKREIDLGYIRCPICDDGLEDVDHALFKCKFANEIWLRVFKWWKFDQANIPLSVDCFIGNGFNFQNTSVKEIWQSVVWDTCYTIWNNRNATVFGKSKMGSAMILSEIQLRCFEWINNRSKSISLDWNSWLTNPINLESQLTPSANGFLGMGQISVQIL